MFAKATSEIAQDFTGYSSNSGYTMLSTHELVKCEVFQFNIQSRHLEDNWEQSERVRCLNYLLIYYFNLFIPSVGIYPY